VVLVNVEKGTVRGEKTFKTEWFGKSDGGTGKGVLCGRVVVSLEFRARRGVGGLSSLWGAKTFRIHRDQREKKQKKK